MSMFDAGVIWFLIGLVYVLATSDSQTDAMAVCQLTHSYDTCFSAMNR
jgi:hypothetical protein